MSKENLLQCLIKRTVYYLINLNVEIFVTISSVATMSKKSFSIQTQNSSFEDECSVHPLNMLINNLVAEIDDDIYRTLKQRSREKLAGQFNRVNNSLNLFYALRDTGTDEDFVSFLKSLMGDTSLHGECGKFFNLICAQILRCQIYYICFKFFFCIRDFIYTSSKESSV